MLGRYLLCGNSAIAFGLVLLVCLRARPLRRCLPALCPRFELRLLFDESIVEVSAVFRHRSLQRLVALPPMGNILPVPALLRGTVAGGGLGNIVGDIRIGQRCLLRASLSMQSVLICVAVQLVCRGADRARHRPCLQQALGLRRQVNLRSGAIFLKLQLRARGLLTPVSRALAPVFRFDRIRRGRQVFADELRSVSMSLRHFLFISRIFFLLVRTLAVPLKVRPILVLENLHGAEH